MMAWSALFLAFAAFTAIAAFGIHIFSGVGMINIIIHKIS